MQNYRKGFYRVSQEESIVKPTYYSRRFESLPPTNLPGTCPTSRQIEREYEVKITLFDSNMQPFVAQELYHFGYTIQEEFCGVSGIETQYYPTSLVVNIGNVEGVLRTVHQEVIACNDNCILTSTETPSNFTLPPNALNLLPLP